MGKQIFIFCLCLYIGISVATKTSYAGYKVYSVIIQNENNFDVLKVFEEIDGIDFWDSLHNIDNSIVRIMISPAKQMEMESLFQLNSISYELIIDDVERLFQRENAEKEFHKARINLAKFDGDDSVDFNHFWELAEINSYLDRLASLNSPHAKVEVVGKSVEGRDIRAVKISFGRRGEINNSRPVILIDATIHAREWISTMVAVYLIHQLVENSANNLEIMQEIDWVIVPVANPDGYLFSHNNERLWRKTRARTNLVTCIGVDPNRNFDIEWGGAGSSALACSNTFRGPSAGSEPEVQSISNLILRYNSTALYLAMHSHGDMLLYPWGFARQLIVNHELHHRVGELYTNAVFGVSGNRYRLGNSATVLYTASGTGADYAAAVGVPLAYTVELPGGGRNGFDIPASRIVEVLNETFAGVIEMAKFVARK